MCLHTKQPSPSAQTINKHVTWSQPLSHVTWYFMSMCVSISVHVCYMPDRPHCHSLVPSAEGRDIRFFPPPPWHQELGHHHRCYGHCCCKVHPRTSTLPGCSHRMGVWVSAHRVGPLVIQYLPTYSAVPTRFRIFCPSFSWTESPKSAILMSREPFL